MSVKVMSAVWEREDLDASERLVMLSLADHADDEGRCYPSIARLSKRTSMSGRGVQKVLSRLSERGFLTVELGAGRGGANVYTVNATPEPRSPLNQVHPEPCSPPPLNVVRVTPEPRSPKPSRTISETSSSKTDAQEVRKVLEEWASPDAVSSFIAYRSKQRGKGVLTVTAAKRVAENLKAIFNGGGDCDDALGLAEERVWLTITPDWYFKAKGNGHGNGNYNNRSAADDPALRAIAIAARGL